MILVVIVACIIIGFLILWANDSSKNQNALDIEGRVSKKAKIFDSINQDCMQFIRLQIFHAVSYYAYSIKDHWESKNIWLIVQSIIDEIYSKGIFNDFLSFYYYGVIFAASEQANLNILSHDAKYLYCWLMSQIYNEEHAFKNIEAIITTKTLPIGEKPTDEMLIIIAGHRELTSFNAYINVRIKVSSEYYKPLKKDFLGEFFPFFAANTTGEFLSFPATMLHYCMDNKLKAKEAFAFYNFLLDNHKDYLINKINIPDNK